MVESVWTAVAGFVGVVGISFASYRMGAQSLTLRIEHIEEALAFLREQNRSLQDIITTTAVMTQRQAETERTVTDLCTRVRTIERECCDA